MGEPRSEHDLKLPDQPALTGGCLCGAIRYEARGGPYHRGYCHCVTCRRASGAPVVAWFSVKLPEFRLVQGEPKVFISSDHGERRFCGDCGSQLFFDDYRYPDEIDIATASLDDPNPVPPGFHLFTRSRIAWVKFGDGLPTFPEART